MMTLCRCLAGDIIRVIRWFWLVVAGSGPMPGNVRARSPWTWPSLTTSSPSITITE